MSKELVLLCAPQLNGHYKDVFIETVKFQINFANLISGKNHCIVLAQKETIPYVTGGHPKLIRESIPEENILQANIKDIWIRDFGTIFQTDPVAFKYRPLYHKSNLANKIQNGFFDVLKSSGIEIFEKSTTGDDVGGKPLSINCYSDLNLDGGNVVYNFSDAAIVTDRFLEENKTIKDRESAKKTLQKVLGREKTALITQFGDVEEDTTGHADLRVSFIDDNTVAFGKIEPKKQEKLVAELRSGLGENVKLIELPNYYYEEKSFDGFTSGCGFHTNSLVTRNFVYMPTFGDDPKSQAKGYTVENDERVYQIIRDNTNKHVVKVPVPYDLCVLGGSVRCLSMQLEGPIAERLISLAEGR